MSTMVKCRYSYCQRFHSSNEIDKDHAVKIGKRYYHPDCLKELKDIKDIIDLYMRDVDPNCIPSFVRKIINDIVYKKNISAEYLLFGLQYYIFKNIHITSPMALYYISQNLNVEKAWKNANLRNIIAADVPYNGPKSPMKYKFHIDDQNHRKYEFENQKPKGFEDILE